MSALPPEVKHKLQMVVSVPITVLAAGYTLYKFEVLHWVVLGLAAVSWLFVCALVGSKDRTYRKDKLPVPSFWKLMIESFSSAGNEQKLRDAWIVYCHKAGWIKKKQGAQPTPLPLTKIRPDRAGDVRASIDYGAYALDLDEITAATSTLASTIHCKRVVVEPTGSGHCNLIFRWSDPLSEQFPVKEMPWAPKGRAAFGRLEDGSAASIPIGMHALIVASTRSGKSRAFRALLTDLVRQKIYVDFYVGDPSGGVELAMLTEHEGAQMGYFRVRDFAESNIDITKKGGLFDRAFSAMECRMRDMKERRENPHKATQKEPLVIVVTDETLGLDKSALKEERAYGQMLSRGAKANWWVIALAQEGHADVLGTIRNLFPVRVGLRMPNRFNVDAALNDNAVKLGAHCHKISEAKTDRGLGYMFTEGYALPQKFRAADVDDEAWAYVSKGMLPPDVPAERPRPASKNGYWVYEVPGFPDENGAREHLYVGKTEQLPADRFEGHEKDRNEPWWLPMGTKGNEVDATAIKLTQCKNKQEMDRLEEKLIKKTLPKYNTIFNLNNPRRVNRRLKGRPVKKVGKATVTKLDTKRRDRVPAGPVDYEGEHSEQAWGE